jgi:lipopolysaccharide transport system ATP-binding protein
MVSGLSSSLRDDEMWALCDASFEVKQGEVLGIIGRNGAGKSTLLKILSRVTAPTSGEVRVKGRIASLLEVGTGFHPELTGRENIFLNGAILGMTKAEIDDKLDDIVDFAEIEKFLDTPVKRYSSGMYVRLAFAVAAHLEPEILIVDEVLAVGDMEFQKKCLGKMGDVARGGRTVLFVSHNMATVEALCGRCLLLQDGCVTKDGSVAEVVGHYAYARQRLGAGTINLSDAARSGSGKARIVSIRVLDRQGVPTPAVRLGDPLQLELEFTCSQAIRAPGFGIVFHTLDGRRVLRVQSSEMLGALPPCQKGGKVICRIEEVLLAPGPYLFSVGINNAEIEIVDRVELCAEFDVHPTDFYGTGRLPNQAASSWVAKGNWLLDYQ